MIKFGTFKMNASLNRALLILLLLVSSTIYSQKSNFKKVKLKDVLNNVYELDSTANAVVLHKYRTTYFNDLQPDKWEIITEIHERIKILNTKGLSYATNHIQLRKSSDNKEMLSNFKGFVYSYNGMRIITRKIKKEAIKKSELSDSLDVVKIEFPTVKAGDIVEYSYKIVSPFYKIDNVVLQEDIPIKYCYNSIKTPSYFSYNRILNSRLKVTTNEFEQQFELKPFTTKKYSNIVQRHLRIYTRDSVLHTTEKVVEYEVKNVKALKSEIYVDNIENYRAFIGYELISTDFPKQGFKDYSNSWSKVIKKIHESNQFGGQLINLHFLKNEAALIKSKYLKPKEIMQKAFELIKNKMSWNKGYGIFAQRNLKLVYEKNTGNIAEINLLLTGLLRECGLNAQPILSRSRTMATPFQANPDNFNYVLVAVNIEGERVLLDATEKLSNPNILPERALISHGMLVFNDGSFENISLHPNNVNQINTVIQAEINHDGSISGKKRSNYTGQEALKYRKNYIKQSKKEFNKHLISNYNLVKLLDFNVENLTHLKAPIIETIGFQMKDGITINANEMYISPLLFLKIKSNPFKSTDRKYPINFLYPLSEKQMVSINIPKGYKVSFIPKPISIALPNQMGSYLFKIKKEGEHLNIISSFKLNSTNIPANKYLELKTFYKQRVLKENEKVILTKLL